MFMVAVEEKVTSTETFFSGMEKEKALSTVSACDNVLPVSESFKESVST